MATAVYYMYIIVSYPHSESYLQVNASTSQLDEYIVTEPLLTFN